MTTNTEVDEEISSTPPKRLHSNSWLKIVLELFVVFAGVTAGFLLNNWWTSRADKVLEKNYYERFIVDIENDIKQMKYVYSTDSTWFTQNQWLNNELSANRLTKENITKAVSCLNGTSTADLTRTTYNDLTSSGSWHIITDNTLSKDLHIYYEEVANSIKYIDDQVLQFYYMHFNPFIYKNYSFRNKQLVNFGEPLALEVVNYYDFIYSFQQRRMQELAKHIAYSQKLVIQIKNKL